MGMRRSDAFLIGILIASNIIPILLSNVLKSQDPVVKGVIQFSLSFGLIGGLILKNKMTQYDGSGYDILRANMDGETNKDLPVRKSWKRATTPNPRAPWLNVTPFEFPYEIKIPGYGEKVKRIHITHFGSITSRLDSIHQENVQFKGDEIEHNNVYLVELWKNDKFPVSQEEGMEEPNFVLVSASKADRSDKKMKTRILATAFALDKIYLARISTQPKTIKEAFQRLTLENERLMQENVEHMMLEPQLVEAASYWKIESIATKGKLEATVQENIGMIDDPMNVRKAAVRSNDQKTGNIKDVMDINKGEGNFIMNNLKWIAAIAIALIVVAFLASNPKIFQTISNMPTSTLVLYVILAGMLVVAIYYIAPIIRGKKE